MAYYLVRANPDLDKLDELHKRLDNEEFKVLRPFGRSLTKALEGARYDSTEHAAVWEQEDYCSPPLAQERAAVLDDYFDDITVEGVNRDDGWTQIEHLPSLWEVPIVTR